MFLCSWRRVAWPVPVAALLVSAPARARSVRFPAAPVRFGQVEGPDLAAAPFVAGNAAAVLRGFGRTRLKGHGSGFRVVYEQVTRLKALKKAGFGEPSVEIPRYAPHPPALQSRRLLHHGWKSGPEHRTRQRGAAQSRLSLTYAGCPATHC